jgi:porin
MRRELQFALAALAALCIAYDARGQGGEGLGTFRHAAAPAPEPVLPTEAPADPWAAVPTEFTSLANVAPGLLPFFNNAPVFGLPGTVLGGLRERTQLTGDWGGLRTELARQGFFFDLYTTSTYQNLA